MPSHHAHPVPPSSCPPLPPEAPDLDTLRAGVPGSYVSISRIRDPWDQVQLRMSPNSSQPHNQQQHQSQRQHQQLQQQSPGRDGLVLQLQPTPHAAHPVDLETHLLAHRMAEWSVLQANSSTDSRGHKEGPPRLTPFHKPTRDTSQHRSLTAEPGAVQRSVNFMSDLAGPAGWDADAPSEGGRAWGRARRGGEEGWTHE